MDANRLTVHNESHLNGELVERLVRFAIDPLDVNRSRIAVLVKDGGHRSYWRTRIYDRRYVDSPKALRAILPPRTRFVFVVRVGHPTMFPSKDLADWREAVVAAVAYTARLAQDSYDNQRASRRRCRAWQAWMLSRLRAVDETWARPLSYSVGARSRRSSLAADPVAATKTASLFGGRD